MSVSLASWLVINRHLGSLSFKNELEELFAYIYVRNLISDAITWDTGSY